MADPLLDELRGAVDEALRAFLARRRDDLARAAPGALPVLEEVERALPGGKRLRPAFCWWGHRAGGGGPEGPIVPAAASLELLHTFALLHDDVMDWAGERRGKPAAFRRIAAEHAAAGGGGDHLQFGISVAILAGDLAFALSDQMFTESGFPPEALARAFPALHALRGRAAAGQFLDLLYTGDAEAPAAAVRLAARLKTASYSIEGPLLVGAALAGAPPGVEEPLAAYGAALGEAYQLGDDVLGLFGDPAVTGKDVGSDVRLGRPTPLVAEALTRAGGAQREVLLGAWGNHSAGPSEVEAVREVVRGTGALDAIVTEIERLVAAAREAVAAKGRLPAEAAGALASLAGLVRLEGLGGPRRPDRS